MAVSDSVDPASWFAERIGACEPDLLREMVKTLLDRVGDGQRADRELGGAVDGGVGYDVVAEGGGHVDHVA